MKYDEYESTDNYKGQSKSNNLKFFLNSILSYNHSSSSTQKNNSQVGLSKIFNETFYDLNPRQNNEIPNQNTQ